MKMLETKKGKITIALLICLSAISLILVNRKIYVNIIFNEIYTMTEMNTKRVEVNKKYGLGFINELSNNLYAEMANIEKNAYYLYYDSSKRILNQEKPSVIDDNYNPIFLGYTLRGIQTYISAKETGLGIKLTLNEHYFYDKYKKEIITVFENPPYEVNVERLLDNNNIGGIYKIYVINGEKGDVIKDCKLIIKCSEGAIIKRIGSDKDVYELGDLIMEESKSEYFQEEIGIIVDYDVIIQKHIDEIKIDFKLITENYEEEIETVRVIKINRG